MGKPDSQSLCGISLHYSYFYIPGCVETEEKYWEDDNVGKDYSEQDDDEKGKDIIEIR
jgi:hypothetical protein